MSQPDHLKRNAVAKKLWGGRFQADSSSIMERIGESVSFDQRLYNEDINGSINHAKVLAKAGILNKEEFARMESGLEQIRKEIAEGRFNFNSSLEDIHMNIETALIDKIGAIGKKLHTGRSRNDQIGLDCRLFIRKETENILHKIKKLLNVIYKRADESTQIIIPGFTHLQVAQPIRLSHYFLSYFWAFQRDYQQFEFSLKLNDLYVLGSGALAGVNYPLDRKFGAEDLGFSQISNNSIDAVSHRDHFLNYLFAASQFMIHASRLCEEIIIYNSQEFSFIHLPDDLTTGSSIMPQKKNPDIAELIRGKSARVIANLNHMQILLKGLPLAYNRDLQEDKIPLFDTTDQMILALDGLIAMLETIEFKQENMENSLKAGFATATDLADYLVNKRKIPFRDAHELVGKLIALCVSEKKNLFDVDEEKREIISEYFIGDEYYNAISLEKSTDKKDVFGGTALNRQKEQLNAAKNILQDLDK